MPIPKPFKPKSPKPENMVNLFEKALTVPSRLCAECGPPKYIEITVAGRKRMVPTVCEHLLVAYEAGVANRERENRTGAMTSKYGNLVSTAWQNEELTLRDDLPGIEKPMMVARFMIETLPTRLEAGDGLILQGAPGNGKSHLSKWIARQAADKGYFVMWVKIKMLCDLLRDWDNRADLVRALQSADLLVLDELVHASETRWTADELMGIVDARHNDRKSTILTTNFTDKAIHAHYMDVLTRKDGYDRDKATTLVQRFMSRLQPPQYRRVAFTGPDYRVLLRKTWGPEDDT